MASVVKRETRAEKERNRTEARVGLASNLLGITAGTAALATASRNKAFRTGSVADAGPVTSRIVRRSRGRIGPRGVGRLVRAGAAGAVGLQAANLAGDLVANRVLTRESQKKVSKMSRSVDGQSVSKAVFGYGETGVGVNLESVSKKALKCPHCEIPCDKDGKCPMCGKDCRPGSEKGEQRWERKHKVEKATRRNETRDRVLYGAGIGSGAGAVGGYVVQRKTGRAITGIMRLGEDEIDRRLRGPNRLIAEQEIQERKAARAKAGYERAKFERMMRQERMQGRLRVAHASESIKSKGVRESAAGARRALLKRGGRGALIGAAIGGLYGAAIGAESVKKYRRFDSEADRQRRLGLYAGGAAGTAVVAGNELRRMVEPVRGEQPKAAGKYVKGKRPVRGLKLRAGASPRKAAIAAALTAGGALVAAGSYKRGVSRRNQPWT